MLEQVKTRFWNVASCTYRQLLEEMEEWRKAGDRHRYTCFCDAMGLAKGWRMGALRHAYRGADAVLADGAVLGECYYNGYFCFHTETSAFIASYGL